KDRMYEHEEIPPAGTWERIASELDNSEKFVFMPGIDQRRKSRFSRLAAAASIILIIIAAIFIMNRKNDSGQAVSSNNISGQENSINIPEKENRYITVTSPEGKKIKVSSKFSDAIGSLYQSPDENSAWAKKFTKWREIMQNESLAPATASFLDIMEMTDFLEQAN
ncbi:MAG: hypothetical protein ABIQ56_06670, partial [Chitinophagaceae bacterium]